MSLVVLGGGSEDYSSFTGSWMKKSFGGDALTGSLAQEMAPSAALEEGGPDAVATASFFDPSVAEARAFVFKAQLISGLFLWCGLGRCNILCAAA